jgi:carbonic anhydrase
MKPYEILLQNNKDWAEGKKASDPDFFERLSHLQTPEFLWIGCSDSRVPANEITGTDPGEIFVHRNVANLVINTDVNVLSVLDYAVNQLKVKHIIVCGHYGCGGVKAAITNHDFKPVLNMWLRNIKDVYRIHRSELDLIADEEQKTNRLTELNVMEQVLINFYYSKGLGMSKTDLHGWHMASNGLIKLFE